VKLRKKADVRYDEGGQYRKRMRDAGTAGAPDETAQQPVQLVAPAIGEAPHSSEKDCRLPRAAGSRDLP
jgi:hypothetical protein